MIQTIIEALDLAASEVLPVVTRHGLAEQRGGAPHVYAGDGQWTPIATDAGGTFSYWRLTGPVSETSVEGTSCNNDFQATYQLRLVSFLDREVCPSVIDAARAAMSAIRGSDDGIRQAIGLRRVGISTARMDVDSPRVYAQEFGSAGDVPTDRMLVAIDATLVVIGKAQCFLPCGEVKSLLCASVSAASWARIKACMSEAQIDAAEADLCEGGPCDPTTVNGTESDTPTILVQQGGVNVGTLNPATGVHNVPECDPCPFDIELYVDAVLVDTILDVEPCINNTLNINWN